MHDAGNGENEMIKTEYLNKKTLIKHYSDNGHYIMLVETGTEYEEAIDIVPCPYTYVETTRLIETSDEE